MDDQLIAEISGTGTVLREYVWLEGEPFLLAEYTGANAGMYFYVNDHLGTPQQLLNGETGAVAWQAAYLPFGEAQVQVSAVTNNLRFPGQYFDIETGFHYNWNRYYDTKTGRYISADPVGIYGGLNLYVYVYNNTINAIDSEGLIEIKGIVDEPIYVHKTDADPFPSNPHGHIGSQKSSRKVAIDGKIYRGTQYTGENLTPKQLKKFKDILIAKGFLKPPILIFIYEPLVHYRIECLQNPQCCETL